jgi:hypothetical protein
MKDATETNSPEDEEIIQGLREAERFYEATSRVINIPSLVEEVRKHLMTELNANTQKIQN